MRLAPLAEKKMSKRMRHYYKHRHPCVGCGCLVTQLSERCRRCNNRENPAQLRHGFAKKNAVHPVHKIWRAMLQRCTNPRDRRYASYGRRGIRVCERWLSFENFIADIGERPEGKTPGGRAAWQLDRIDNDGDYEPGNVRWVWYQKQSERTTRVRLLTCRGRTQSITAWARELGVTNNCALLYRLRRGLSVEETLSPPFRKRR